MRDNGIDSEVNMSDSSFSVSRTLFVLIYYLIRNMQSRTAYIARKGNTEGIRIPEHVILSGSATIAEVKIYFHCD